MNRIFYLIWIVPAYAVMYCLLPAEVDWHAGAPWCGTVSPPPASVVSYSGSETVGEKLFLDNCARCHNSKLERNSTGPALLGVSNRMPGGDWPYSYIRNADSMRKAGDAYALKLDAEYPDAEMDPMPHLTRADITAIMQWIDAWALASQP
jgi:mono/diheme cytochrome c family protein